MDSGKGYDLASSAPFPYVSPPTHLRLIHSLIIVSTTTVSPPTSTEEGSESRLARSSGGMFQAEAEPDAPTTLAQGASSSLHPILSSYPTAPRWGSPLWRVVSCRVSLVMSVKALYLTLRESPLFSLFSFYFV
jgi:hypothetical protein